MRGIAGYLIGSWAWVWKRQWCSVDSDEVEEERGEDARRGVHAVHDVGVAKNMR